MCKLGFKADTWSGCTGEISHYGLTFAKPVMYLQNLNIIHSLGTSYRYLIFRERAPKWLLFLAISCPFAFSLGASNSDALIIVGSVRVYPSY